MLSPIGHGGDAPLNLTKPRGSSSSSSSGHHNDARASRSPLGGGGPARASSPRRAAQQQPPPAHSNHSRGGGGGGGGNSHHTPLPVPPPTPESVIKRGKNRHKFRCWAYCGREIKTTVSWQLEMKGGRVLENPFTEVWFTFCLATWPDTKCRTNNWPAVLKCASVVCRFLFFQHVTQKYSSPAVSKPCSSNGLDLSSCSPVIAGSAAALQYVSNPYTGLPAAAAHPSLVAAAAAAAAQQHHHNNNNGKPASPNIDSVSIYFSRNE